MPPEVAPWDDEIKESPRLLRREVHDGSDGRSTVEIYAHATRPSSDEESLPAVVLEKVIARESKAVAKQESRAVKFLGSALVLAMVSSVLGWGGNFIDNMYDSAGTSPSTCLSAIQNVGSALDSGIRDPVLLERLNEESIDSQCGEESVIAADILKNKPR